MSNKIDLCGNIISQTMHFIISLTLFIVAQTVLIGVPAPFYMQMMFLLCYSAIIVIRYLVNANFLIYMIAHVTLYTTLFLIPVSSLMFIVFAVFFVAMTVQSVMFWKKNGNVDKSEVPWFSIVVFCISYIYAYVDGHNLLRIYLLVTGVLFLLMFMANFYVESLYQLSKNTMFHSHLPLQQIVKTNSVIIALIIAVTFMTILLANIIDLDHLIYNIGDGIVAVIRVFLRSLFAILSWFASLFEGDRVVDLGSLVDSFSNIVKEESFISKLLNVLFAVIKIVATSFFVLWVLRGANKRVRQYLKDNVLPTDKVTSVKAKEPESRDIIKHVFASVEPNNSIRKRYRREVLKNKGDLVLTNFLTTGEIEAGMDERTARKMRPLKEAYEAERYRDEQ
ncbi:MAG: hypothetical protein E7271_08135 [Lachnospiraceae bacterium]|nr:hypothetical protein [Lachnospiraceae bacterium]